VVLLTLSTRSVDDVYMEAVALPTRDRLVATARRLLDAEGLEPLTLREIARRGGLSHGAPLRHFPSLATLLSAVAAQGFRELMESVDTAVGEASPGASPVERLAAAGRGYVRFALGSPGLFALMFRPERLDPSDASYREAGTAAFDQLRQLVSAAQASGFHPDVSTMNLAAVAWASVHGLAQLWLQGALQGAGDHELDPTLDVMHRLMLGVGAAPKTTRTRRRKVR
jgi:AcrR family transcriptional regulator